ncbi:MAG: PTS sugar transporter subunit IIA [Acidobacteriota bacterium]
MKLADFLGPDAVIPELQGRDPRSVLADLSAPIAEAEGLSTSELVEGLLEREALGSTAVGDGVALPHARFAKLTRLTASFGRSRAGIPFGAADGEPVHLFFAIFTPEDLAGAHLKALAHVSRVLGNPAIREAALSAADADEIYRALISNDRPSPVVPDRGAT